MSDVAVDVQPHQVSVEMKIHGHLFGKQSHVHVNLLLADFMTVQTYHLHDQHNHS